MQIKEKARAGTLESGDVLVTVQPWDRLELTLESPVKAQFGDQILDLARKVLDREGIESGRISLEDQGALDCTIQARLTTALRRAGEKGGD